MIFNGYKELVNSKVVALNSFLLECKTKIRKERLKREC